MTESITPAGGTDLLTRDEVGTDNATQHQEPGHSERFAHHVDAEKLVKATLEGTPVVALCGKVWVPKNSPKGLPVCPVCAEVYQAIRPGDNRGGKNDPASW